MIDINLSTNSFKVVDAPGHGTPGECQAALLQIPQNSTIRKIIEALGGIEKFSQYPLLVWQDHFAEGGTGYIDGVQPEDMPQPIMRGVDPFHRPFIAIRTNDGVETLFQRYVNDSSIWTSGNHYLHGSHELVVSRVDDQTIRLLDRLYRGGITYIDTYRECSMLNELKQSGMFSEAPEIEKAITKIISALERSSNLVVEISNPSQEMQAALHKLTDTLKEMAQSVEKADPKEYQSIKTLIGTIEQISKGEDLELCKKTLFKAG